MNITSFVSLISPGQTEIDQISTSGNTIRYRLENGMGFITESFLTGSYKRKTKFSPIDDLDIFFKLSGGSTFYKKLNDNDFVVYVKDSTARDSHVLRDYFTYNVGKDRYELSPIKLLNAIKNKIQSSYSNTPDIARNGQCVTAYFSSYSLTIDSVPCLGIKDESFYLIPKWGIGLLWKKANPKIDEEKINLLNDTDHYNWKLKGAIKVLKYWNRHRNSGISFKSYTLEALIYHGLNIDPDYSLSYVEVLKKAIIYIYNNVDNHQNILDIPWYEYMYYSMDTNQKERLKSSLSTLWSKLINWDDTFTSYLLTN